MDSHTEQLIVDQLGELNKRDYEIQQQIAALRREQEVLQANREFVKTFHERVKSLSKGGVQRSPIEEEAQKELRAIDLENSATVRGSTTKAVMEYVSQKPYGVSASEAADALENEIDSNASDKRRVIMNTLINLKNRELLVYRDERYHLPENNN